MVGEVAPTNLASGNRSGDFDDRAVWVLQEDLIPATDGPNAVVGELNVLFSQHCLECLYVVCAKRNVAAIERIEALFGSECYAEVLRCNMKLGRAVRQKRDLSVVALRGDLSIFVAGCWLHFEKGLVKFRDCADVLGRVVHVMEFQFHEISLSAGQLVMTLCRKPPIMKLAVVADPKTNVSFGSNSEVLLLARRVRCTLRSGRR